MPTSSPPPGRARSGDVCPSCSTTSSPCSPPARFDALLDALTHEVAGLGPLEPLLADPTVTEVMVNGPGHAYVERRGRLEPIALGLDAAGIVHLVERVVAPSACGSIARPRWSTPGSPTALASTR